MQHGILEGFLSIWENGRFLLYSSDEITVTLQVQHSKFRFDTITIFPCWHDCFIYLYCLWVKIVEKHIQWPYHVELGHDAYPLEASLWITRSIDLSGALSISLGLCLCLSSWKLISQASLQTNELLLQVNWVMDVVMLEVLPKLMVVICCLKNYILHWQ